MRPSINAILGYSYQKMIAFLLLAKMDVEREIEHIELEANVEHNFDDVTICFKSQSVYCQMKDYKDITITDLKKMGDTLSIKGIKHKLSNEVNVVFIKNIKITPNAKILGFQALNLDGVFIVSITREGAWDIINSFYELNEQRISKLEVFFDKLLDERKLLIKRCDLPYIDIYSTELMDKCKRQLLFHKYRQLIFHKKRQLKFHTYRNHFRFSKFHFVRGFMENSA